MKQYRLTRVLALDFGGHTAKGMVILVARLPEDWDPTTAVLNAKVEMSRQGGAKPTLTLLPNPVHIEVLHHEIRGVDISTPETDTIVVDETPKHETATYTGPGLDRAIAFMRYNDRHAMGRTTKDQLMGGTDMSGVVGRA